MEKNKIPMCKYVCIDMDCQCFIGGKMNGLISVPYKYRKYREARGKEGGRIIAPPFLEGEIRTIKCDEMMGSTYIPEKCPHKVLHILRV